MSVPASVDPNNPSPPAAATLPASPDTSTIKEMRAALDAKSAELKEAAEARKAAEARLTEIERAKLEENERLKLELADRDKKIGELEPLRDELGQYVSQFEALYKKELEGVPEDKREAVAAISAKGTWAERYALVQNAKAIMGAPESAGTRTAAGAVPPGGRAGEGQPPASADPKAIANLGWDDAFQRPAK